MPRIKSLSALSESHIHTHSHAVSNSHSSNESIVESTVSKTPTSISTISRVSDSVVLAPLDEVKLTKLCEAQPKYESMLEALDNKDAGLSEIAHTVGYLMKYAESDAVKLQSARLAAELRGVAKGKDSNTINFIITHNEDVNLQGIFNPQR